MVLRGTDLGLPFHASISPAGLYHFGRLIGRAAHRDVAALSDGMPVSPVGIRATQSARDIWRLDRFKTLTTGIG